jgi:hypothetical protein
VSGTKPKKRFGVNRADISRLEKRRILGRYKTLSEAILERMNAALQVAVRLTRLSLTPQQNSPPPLPTPRYNRVT